MTSLSPGSVPFRITQSDVARAAKVSRTTVALALKDDPCLPAKTRERVKRIARELGYSPDPLFAKLAHYRRQRSKVGYHGLLAWLAWDSDIPYGPHYLGYRDGAMARAPYHGYKVEEFCFDVAETSPKRAGSIFRSRGISGILLCPHLLGRKVLHNFPWESFSCISFGYSLREPALHMVASAHYQNVRTALAKLRAQGYRRIGLSISTVTDIRCNEYVSSAFLKDQFRITCEATRIIPPLLHKFTLLSSDRFKDYLACVANYAQKYQLEVVLTADYQVADMDLRSYKVPFVGLSLPRPSSTISGIVEDSEYIGAVALDHLAAMIQRGERGIPKIPFRIHIEGEWNEAKQLGSDSN